MFCKSGILIFIFAENNYSIYAHAMLIKTPLLHQNLGPLCLSFFLSLFLANSLERRGCLSSLSCPGFWDPLKKAHCAFTHSRGHPVPTCISASPENRTLLAFRVNQETSASFSLCSRPPSSGPLKDQQYIVYIERWHHFVNIGPSSQSYCFSSSLVWMWELDHKEEGWVPKNWCFQIVVLEKTPWTAWRSNQSILKEIKVLHWKDWCWSWISNILATDANSWLIGKDPDAGKDWGQEEKGTTEEEMVR